MKQNRKNPRRRFYDIDHYREVYFQTLRTRTGFWKILGRFTAALDSVQGFFVAFLGAVIAYGTVLAVVIGAYFGPFVFLALWGSIIGGLAFVAEKKVGQSLQFGEYRLWRRTLAVSLAFLLTLGVILFFLSLNKIRPF